MARPWRLSRIGRGPQRQVLLTVPKGLRTEYGTAPRSPPPICLTTAKKLRNVTQHKSGLVWSWRPASVSEPQRAALAVPLAHLAANLVAPTALCCAALCCVVLCGDCVALLSCVHQASSQFPPSNAMPSQPTSITRRLVGCAPQTLGSCIVGSHQASPHHRCIEWRWRAVQPCWQAIMFPSPQAPLSSKGCSARTRVRQSSSLTY